MAALKGRAWALLQRAPAFVDVADLPRGAHFAVNCAEPPHISTLYVDRARALLAAGGGDPENLFGRIHCADGDGNILLSVWCEREEQGRPSSAPRFLVCRPGPGAVDIVPAVPAEDGDLEAAILGGVVGILGGAGDYSISLLLRGASAGAGASSSSSSSAAAPGQRALVFCSRSSAWEAKAVHPLRRFHAPSSSDDEPGWTIVKEEAEQEPPPTLQAEVVLCDEAGRRLLFLDAEHGLVLVFDPKDADAARLVPLPPVPECDELGMGLEEDFAVYFLAYSDGGMRLYRCSATSTTSWCFQAQEEEADPWKHIFRVAMDEIINCDPSLGPPAQLVLRAVDPSDGGRLIFLAFSGAEQNCAALTVAFDPEGTASRIRFVDKVLDVGSDSWADTVVWYFFPSSAVARVAMPESAATRCGRWLSSNLRARGIGGMARCAFSFARDNVESFAHMIPYGPAIVNLNKAADMGGKFLDWYRQPSPPDLRPVGTYMDAERIIAEWYDRNQPADLFALPAPEMSEQEQAAMTEYFCSKGAKKLLRLKPKTEAFDMVGRAEPYFPAPR